MERIGTGTKEMSVISVKSSSFEPLDRWSIDLTSIAKRPYYLNPSQEGDLLAGQQWPAFCACKLFDNSGGDKRSLCGERGKTFMEED